MQRQRSTVIQTSSVSGGQTRNAALFNEPKANSAFEFMSNCFYNNLGLSMTVKKTQKPACDKWFGTTYMYSHIVSDLS